jgi:Alpha/beta hydrolase domain
MTGWLFRSERIGAPHTLMVNSGGYIPFAVTRAEREKTREPRRSIEERYSGRADYLAKVTEVAKRLAAERYVLERDVPAIIEAAGKHWDWRMTGAQSSGQREE